MVYMHLPDYREEHTHPLDIVGLILFGSGIALLSYVLEIFGEHRLSVGEISGLLAVSFALIGRLPFACQGNCVSVAGIESLPYPHL